MFSPDKVSPDKVRLFSHFFRNQSLNVSDFLHDVTRHYKVSFECVFIHGQNLGIKGDKVSIIRVLDCFLLRLSLKGSDFLHFVRRQ